MRVHIGISLSVLSLSVLAKVIPNDGSHGSLLVRRTVDPDPMDFSWRRNNGDDKQGSSLPDSGAGTDAEAGDSSGAEAGASASSDDSSPNQPSGSGELNKVSQTPDSTEEPRWLFQEQLLPHRSKHILDSDERLIQKAIEKVTGAFEGEQANQVISEIKALLTHVLNSIRMFLESYEGRISVPFYLFTPVGSNSYSLFEEMVSINQHQRDLVIKLLGITVKAISRIIKKPQKVANRLRDIVYKAQLLRNYISFQYYTYYTALFSKMDTTENRAYVEVTKDYIRQMDSDWDLALELLEKIKGMVNDGMMRLKPVPSRFSSLTSSVKKRLGIKDGPPADTTTD